MINRIEFGFKSKIKDLAGNDVTVLGKSGNCILFIPVWMKHASIVSQQIRHCLMFIFTKNHFLKCRIKENKPLLNVAIIISSMMIGQNPGKQDKVICKFAGNVITDFPFAKQQR